MKKTVALTNWSVICLKPWRHYCYLDLAIKQSKLPEEAEKKGKTQLNPEKLRIKVCLCPFLLSNLCRLYNFILTGALIVHLKSWKQHLLYLFLFHMHNQRLVLWMWKFIFTFQLNQSLAVSQCPCARGEKCLNSFKKAQIKRQIRNKHKVCTVRMRNTEPLTRFSSSSPRTLAAFSNCFPSWRLVSCSSVSAPLLGPRWGFAPVTSH